MPPAGRIAPLALAAWAALAGCEHEAQSPAEVRDRVTAERHEGQREIEQARAEARRELADAKRGEGAASANATDWIQSGPSGGNPSQDPADRVEQIQAEGVLLIEQEKAEADYEVARARCDEQQAGEAREACIERAWRQREAQIKQAQSRYENATQEGGMS